MDKKRCFLIVLFVAITLAVLTLFIILKNAPITIDYEILEADSSQTFSTGIKNRKQIDIADGYVAIIKGKKLDLFKEDKLIESTRGNVPFE